MAELLAVDGVTAGYGASVVLEDISLALDDGDSLALLGRNGVGKSTLLVTLMGLTKVHRGTPRCRRTSARRPASAGCRRSATCGRR
jgi:branched-chain amino acid transport system ATP-binding protein